MLIGLGGCTTMFPQGYPWAPNGRNVHASSPKKPTKKPEPAPRQASTGAAPKAAASTPATPATSTAAIPTDIVGKAEHDVRLLLGAPSAETPRPPGKVLQFVGEGCAVDIHFFPDVKTGGFRALEVVSSAGSVSPVDCVGRIRGHRG